MTALAWVPWRQSSWSQQPCWRPSRTSASSCAPSPHCTEMQNFSPHSPSMSRKEGGGGGGHFRWGSTSGPKSRKEMQHESHWIRCQHLKSTQIFESNSFKILAGDAVMQCDLPQSCVTGSLPLCRLLHTPLVENLDTSNALSTHHSHIPSPPPGDTSALFRHHSPYPADFGPQVGSLADPRECYLSQIPKQSILPFCSTVAMSS